MNATINSILYTGRGTTYNSESEYRLWIEEIMMADMMTLYRANKGNRLEKTYIGWRLFAIDFYKDLGEKFPDNWWDRLVKALDISKA